MGVEFQKDSLSSEATRLTAFFKMDIPTISFPQLDGNGNYFYRKLAGTTLMTAKTIPAARSKTNLLKLNVPLFRTSGNLLETQPICLLDLVDLVSRMNSTLKDSGTYKAAMRMADASQILGADFCFKVHLGERGL